MPQHSALIVRPRELKRRAGAHLGAAKRTSQRALARGVEALVVAGSWLLLPLWPLIAFALLLDRRCLSWYREPGRMTRHIRAVWRTRPISRMLVRQTRSAPRAPQDIVGSCTHCGRCCLEKSCVFLDFDQNEQSRCQIYDRWVWRTIFANCAAYPVDAEEIELYACPGFKAGRPPETSLPRIVTLATPRRREAPDVASASD